MFLSLNTVPASSGVFMADSAPSVSVSMVQLFHKVFVRLGRGCHPMPEVIDSEPTFYRLVVSSDDSRPLGDGPFTNLSETPG